MLDLEALKPEQHSNLKDLLSNRFGIDKVDIDTLLKKFGVPILAADVTASTTDRRVMTSLL